MSIISPTSLAILRHSVRMVVEGLENKFQIEWEMMTGPRRVIRKLPNEGD